MIRILLCILSFIFLKKRLVTMKEGKDVQGKRRKKKRSGKKYKEIIIIGVLERCQPVRLSVFDRG